MTLLRQVLASAALTAVLSLPFALPFAAIAQTPKTASKTAPPTAADIADAKSKGLVWVNTNSDTKAYHKSDDKYYGNTKSGKFMSETDAQKAGYHLAKVSPVGKKTTPPTAPAK